MEKLIKNRLGQWKLVKAWLRPGQETEAGMADEFGRRNKMGDVIYLRGRKSAKDKINPSYNKKITDMYHGIVQGISANSRRAIEHHTQQLRDFLHQAPKGSVDLEHLSRAHDAYKQSDPKGHWQHVFSDKDYLDAVDRHISDKASNSLKDVYDEHGMNTVKGIARAHGINNNPYHEENMGDGLKTPLHPRKRLKHLAGDVQAFVEGDYGRHKVRKEPDKMNSFYDLVSGQKPYPDTDRHDKKISDLYDKMYDIDDDGEYYNHIKTLERAVVDRGEHTFRQKHKVHR